MNEPLEELIKEHISNIKKGDIGPRVTKYSNYKSKYTVLKNTAKVTVELKSGIVAEIDISDYFEEEMK